MAKRYQCEAPDVRGVLSRLTGAGIRRAEIAEAIGVDTDSIGRYIDGRRSPNWVRGWAIMRFAESRRMV